MKYDEDWLDTVLKTQATIPAIAKLIQDIEDYGKRIRVGAQFRIARDNFQNHLDMGRDTEDDTVCIYELGALAARLVSKA